MSRCSAHKGPLPTSRILAGPSAPAQAGKNTHLQAQLCKECRLCFERLDVRATRHCHEDDGAPKRKKKRKEKKKVTFETHCEAHRKEHSREVNLSVARPITKPGPCRVCTEPQAKEVTPEIVDLTMEDTFQEMDINRPSVTVTVSSTIKEEPKNKSETISQVDGLVDSDYGDTDSSEDSSEDTPQVSGSERRPPKRRLADATPDSTYPEWGVIETPVATNTDQVHPDETSPEE